MKYCKYLDRYIYVGMQFFFVKQLGRGLTKFVRLQDSAQTNRQTDNGRKLNT